jgi:hypothetical protein
VLTLNCGGATIKPDYNERAAGVSVMGEPYACLHEWGRRGKVRSTNAIWLASIIGTMAGAEAEIEMLGRCKGGDGDDRRQIAHLAEELGADVDWWTKREPRLRAMARMLVRRHKARIERVAKALLAKETLTAKQLDRLVGRSINDVKVNAPFLLAMATRARAAAVGRPKKVRSRSPRATVVKH